MLAVLERGLAEAPSDNGHAANGSQLASGQNGHGRDREWLEATTVRALNEQGKPLYRCQATELIRSSKPLPWWEMRQYVRDVRMNHVPVTEAAHGFALAVLSKVIQKVTGKAYPDVTGKLKKTPTESLGLQAGDWVVVKSKEEILATLDGQARNRGMSYNAEMLPFCGKAYRVLRRVERIVDEPTGKMLELGGQLGDFGGRDLPGDLSPLLPACDLPVLARNLAARAQPHEVPSCATTGVCTAAAEAVSSS